MEDAQNEMEWKVSKINLKIVFDTNYIYSTGIYQYLQQITKCYQTIISIISHFLVPQCKFLACCDCILLLR